MTYAPFIIVAIYLAAVFWRINKDAKWRYRNIIVISSHISIPIMLNWRTPLETLTFDIGAKVHRYIPGVLFNQATFGRVLYDGEGLRKALGIKSWAQWQAANGYRSMEDVHAPTRCPEGT